MQWPERKWVIVLSLALVVLQPLAAGAARQSMYFRHLTLQDGLSQNTIQTILQDTQGFVWLGSENGLNRYDGYNIVRYHPDRNDPRSLPGDFIWKIAEDRDTNLWIATADGGVARWDRKTDSFHRYQHEEDNPNSLSSDSARTLLVDTEGLIWIGSTNGGLDALDPETGRIEHFRHNPEDPKSLSSDGVYALFQDGAGSIWVGTESGLSLFNPRSRSFLNYHNDPESTQSLSSDRVRAIYEDHQGALWIGTLGGGLNRLNRVTGRFTRFQNDPEKEGSLSHDHVRTILEDDAMRLWVGTADGLNLLHRDTMTFDHFASDGHLGSLQDSYVMSLHQDRSGLLWVGTRSAGTSLWNPRSWTLGHYVAPWLQDTNVTAFASINDRIWVGTFDHGLTLIENNVDTKRFEAPELSDSRVMSLLVDREGLLWVGTMTGGLNRLDPITDEITVYRHEPDNPLSLSADGVMSLYEDRSGKLWIGTFGGGVSQFDPKTSTFQQLREADGLSSSRATTIVEDLDGIIWIGTDAGLNRWDPVDGEIVQYHHDPRDPSSLSSDTIYALHIDTSGNLWIGTAGGGLNRLRETSDKRIGFDSVSQRDGLPSNVVYGIRSDVQGLLWLSTNNGLIQFDPETSEFKTFRKAQGLQGDEFNFGAHHRSESGRLYFGGANGFNVIEPAALETNSNAPEVVLTGLQTLNKPAITRMPYSQLTKFEIDHLSTVITFEFAAMDFTSPSQNQYRYLLEGFDNEWSPPSSVRTATYTNLDAGEYVFRVQASNSDGVWNRDGLTISTVVSPAPWLTSTAYFGYSMFGLLALCLVIQAQMRKRHKENEYRQRLYRLAFFDSLTGIGNRQRFDKNLRDAIKSIEDGELKLALLYIDLDQFKRINDTLGHRAGDEILKLVTERLIRVIKEAKYTEQQLTLKIARLGGDEFVILIVGLHNLKVVDQIARRILESLSSALVYKQYELVVTPSIGISVYPADGRGGQSLLKNAETAMYEAKDAGRNEFVYYSETMNARALEELALEGELRHALENDEMTIGYQPKIDLQTMRIVGAEALLRWNHPARGEISPAKFIPIAEKTGLILEIDHWVVKKVTTQLGEWAQQGLEILPVAINLSGREFGNDGLVWFLSRAVDEAGVASRYLGIEITEGVLMRDSTASKATVTKMESLGFNVFIDDFGTGYSSLSYLKSFPLSALKIDRSFVIDLCKNPQDRAICGAIIAMARGLGLTAIAEGVETEEQVKLLNELGCDQAQGFFFYEAVTREQFAELLAAQAAAPPTNAKLELSNAGNLP